MASGEPGTRSQWRNNLEAMRDPVRILLAQEPSSAHVVRFGAVCLKIGSSKSGHVEAVLNWLGAAAGAEWGWRAANDLRSAYLPTLERLRTLAAENLGIVGTASPWTYPVQDLWAPLYDAACDEIRRQRRLLGDLEASLVEVAADDAATVSEGQMAALAAARLRSTGEKMAP